MTIKFITSINSGHPSYETLLDLEKSIKANTDWVPIDHISPFLLKFLNILLLIYPGVSRVFQFIDTDDCIFTLVMGIQRIRNSFPKFLYKTKFKSIYLFDAWEPDYELIEYTIKKLNINVVFFSAKQSAEYFEIKLPNIGCHWVPEGIPINKYKSYPYERKDIDILQFGRKFDAYHEQIVNFCGSRGIRYLYERVNGKIVFRSKDDFIDGLARTKISVCFPSNITHPERSGGISTTTQRYLQSMAAKCLVIGTMPYDMEVLFDYCPIVEVDMNNPCLQIERILEKYENYQYLIEKNYEFVLNNHT